MNPSVWLIVARGTDEVSYIRHGREGDEVNWRCIGPFAYTRREDAKAAAKDPKFLPVGVRGSFEILEVDTASFIRAVYNGFPPRNTDVFVLDNAFLPLSLQGGAWIDEVCETPIWSALFDEDSEGMGLDWLDKVLETVATRLGVSMETVQAIGTLNAAEEDAEIEQTRSLIRQHVRLTLTPEPETLQIGNGTGGERRLTTGARFWVHSNGLAKLGLPELEIRDVPAWWVTAAGEELLNWAAYSLDHGISDGDVLQGGGPIPLELRATSSGDSYWEGRAQGCLRLEVLTVTFVSDGGGDTPVGSWPSMKMVH